MAIHGVVSLSESIVPLVVEFNLQRDKIRLIALLSPT